MTTIYIYERIKEVNKMARRNVMMNMDVKTVEKADKILKKAKITRSGFCEAMFEMMKENKEGTLADELKPWADKFMKYAQDKVKEKKK